MKTVIFLTVQFSISTLFSSTWPIDRTLSVATTPGQSGPGSNGNERILCIFQNYSISGVSTSDCFVSYPELSLGQSYPSAEMQSVYSAAPADWAANSLWPTDWLFLFRYIYIYIYVCVYACVYFFICFWSSETCLYLHLHSVYQALHQTPKINPLSLHQKIIILNLTFLLCPLSLLNLIFSFCLSTK